MRNSKVLEQVKLVGFVFMFCILLTSATNAQQTRDWLRSLENPIDESERLKPQNFVDKYKEHDASLLFVPRPEFLGFIGKDYRRLFIFYSSITRDPSDPLRYKVTGYSVVKDNRCLFNGSITIRQFREFAKPEYGVDGEYKDAGIKARGVLIGEYRFEERKTDTHSGIFEGVMTMTWHLDRNSILQYDRIMYFADGYTNNQYVGTWTKYGSKEKKAANWGEFRIPMSGDLDVGDGEFSPNEKYLENGWKDLTSQ